MRILRVDRDGERQLVADGPISPRIVASPPGMVIGVMSEPDAMRSVVRYEAIFDAQDLQFTRDAIQRTASPVPTLQELARERRAVWALCPMCGRATKMTAFVIAESLGRDAPLTAIGRKLRCRKCDHRGAALVPDAVAGDLRR